MKLAACPRCLSVLCLFGLLSTSCAESPPIPPSRVDGNAASLLDDVVAELRIAGLNPPKSDAEETAWKSVDVNALPHFAKRLWEAGQPLSLSSPHFASGVDDKFHAVMLHLATHTAANTGKERSVRPGTGAALYAAWSKCRDTGDLTSAPGLFYFLVKLAALCPTDFAYVAEIKKAALRDSAEAWQAIATALTVTLWYQHCTDLVAASTQDIRLNTDRYVVESSLEYAPQAVCYREALFRMGKDAAPVLEALCRGLDEEGVRLRTPDHEWRERNLNAELFWLCQGVWSSIIKEQRQTPFFQIAVPLNGKDVAAAPTVAETSLPSMADYLQESLQATAPFGAGIAWYRSGVLLSMMRKNQQDLQAAAGAFNMAFQQTKTPHFLYRYYRAKSNLSPDVDKDEELKQLRQRLFSLDLRYAYQGSWTEDSHVGFLVLLLEDSRYRAAARKALLELNPEQLPLLLGHLKIPYYAGTPALQSMLEAIRGHERLVRDAAQAELDDVNGRCLPEFRRYQSELVLKRVPQFQQYEIDLLPGGQRQADRIRGGELNAVVDELKSADRYLEWRVRTLKEILNLAAK